LAGDRCISDSARQRVCQELAPLVQQFAGSHNTVILERVAIRDSEKCNERLHFSDDDSYDRWATISPRRVRGAGDMTGISKRLPDDYVSFLAEVKERVRAAQYQALKAVNKHLVGLYWDVGRMIAERQHGESWGKSVVERLASDLQQEFPGVRGFSVQNLWYMRQFYLEYCDNAKLQPLVGEISWSKNLAIMSRCKEPLEREFYIRMTRKFGWSKNVLIHQIDNQSYEKSLLGQTNFDLALTPAQRAQAKLAVKDEYTFDFLELGEEHSERELERALIARIEDFLRAMGGVFAFVGSQFRLEVDGKEYFIDLLLFHRRLRCLVAIDLKIGEFEPASSARCSFTSPPSTA
jgi:predicted nuclease of restriction endonuclease-like (RecB) superfamily